jgi:hypothetical protein
MENVLVVFAGNGFCRMCDKKDGKKHVVRTAKENCIEGSVKPGTRRTKPILKTTIWAGNSKKPLISKRKRSINRIFT